MNDTADRVTCPVCSYPMTRRVRASAQAHLAAEYVCWNMDCLDFGLYRHAAVTGASS